MYSLAGHNRQNQPSSADKVIAGALVAPMVLNGRSIYDGSTTISQGTIIAGGDSVASTIHNLSIPTSSIDVANSKTITLRAHFGPPQKAGSSAEPTELTISGQPTYSEQDRLIDLQQLAISTRSIYGRAKQLRYLIIPGMDDPWRFEEPPGLLFGRSPRRTLRRRQVLQPEGRHCRRLRPDLARSA
jgi:autotransporter-associated beta strand protein